jgi:hypothetical protein
MLIWTIIAFVLQNCSEGNDNNSIRKIRKPVFDNQISLSADSTEIRDVAIAVRNWKINKDQMVILSIRNDDNFLYVFTVPEFTLLYKYGTYGQGPSDYIAVNWLNMNTENQLGLYDIPNRKMYTYHLTDDSLLRDKTFNFEKWDGNLCRPYTFIQQINDSLFLLKADMREYTEIELVNINNGKVLQTFRNLMKRKPNTIFTTYYFYMAFGSDKLVLAYNYIDRIELFQFKESVSAVEPILIIGSDRDQSDSEWESYVKYYTSLYCDENYIYALSQQGEKASAQKNSVIEIYTLKGEAVKKIILDRYIDAIVLDSRTNCIYGSNSEQDFDVVYVYKLPD